MLFPRLAHALTVDHLKDLRDLLPRLRERQYKEVLHLVLLAGVTIRGHTAMHKSPSLFGRAEIIMHGHLCRFKVSQRREVVFASRWEQSEPCCSTVSFGLS